MLVVGLVETFAKTDQPGCGSFHKTIWQVDVQTVWFDHAFARAWPPTLPFFCRALFGAKQADLDIGTGNLRQVGLQIENRHRQSLGRGTKRMLFTPRVQDNRVESVIIVGSNWFPSCDMFAF